jgi:hypothetical protein
VPSKQVFRCFLYSQILKCPSSLTADNQEESEFYIKSLQSLLEPDKKRRSINLLSGGVLK